MEPKEELVTGMVLPGGLWVRVYRGTPPDGVPEVSLREAYRMLADLVGAEVVDGDAQPSRTEVCASGES